MGIFDLFRSKKEQKRSPISVVEEALKSKSMAVTSSEVERVMNTVSRGIRFRTCLPEELEISYSAELTCAESGYIVLASLTLVNPGTGEIPKHVLNTIFSVAVYYAAASELAKEKGFLDFVIKPGQRIALCDFRAFGTSSFTEGHPIYDLFPELLNKTVQA